MLSGYCLVFSRAVVAKYYQAVKSYSFPLGGLKSGIRVSAEGTSLAV